MNTIRTFFITIFPLSIICTHYGIDGFFYWFIMMLAYFITYFVGDTIFTPIYMIWTLVLLRFRITPIAMVYYIVFFVYFYTFYVSMKEKIEVKKYRSENDDRTNNNDANVSQRKNHYSTILLIFCINMICLAFAFHEDKKNTTTDSMPTASSFLPSASTTSSPATDITTSAPTQNPDSDKFRFLDDLNTCGPFQNGTAEYELTNVKAEWDYNQYVIKNVKISFSGAKTYDSFGSTNSSSIVIRFKIYNKDNAVVASGFAMTPMICVGDTFDAEATVSETFPNDNYSIKIENS